MNPHLRNLVALVAERAVDEYLREREAERQATNTDEQEARARRERPEKNSESAGR